MADFTKAFNKLMGLEFNSPSNYLHKNKEEKGHTVAGIYREAHPSWAGWYLVDVAMTSNGHDLKKASKDLHESETFKSVVYVFYRDNYWDAMKLGKLSSQNTAEEIFLFGVNSGKRNAIRKAQKLVGVKDDGIIGPITIRALNECDEDYFDMAFDEVEKQYYASIIERHPSFKIFERGWNNRAESV